MSNTASLTALLEKKGYAILDAIYSIKEVAQIVALSKEIPKASDHLLITKDVVAIRQLINHIPTLKEVLV